MKSCTATVGMLCLTTFTTGSCVMSSTYDEVVVDLETTKAELYSTRAQSQALTEQVSELEQHKIILARQMEATSSALQQAQQEMEAERHASQERLSTFHRMISQLTAQQASLRYGLKRATEEQARLQSAVERDKSKLGEVDGPRASLFPPPIASTNEQADTVLAPPAQALAPNEPALQPTMTTPGAPADPTAAHPKPQPTGKQISEPVEEGWLPMLKEWVITLWRSIFS